MSQEKQTNETTPRKSGKPVIIYIMILFIAAFLLMALSSLMHQRSNTEALGKLQNSVSTMQQIQESQEKIIELQDALADAEEALDTQTQQSEQDIAAAQKALEEQKKLLSAQQKLYCLQQEYSSGDYEGCMKLIESMESSGEAAALPSVPFSTESGSITAPFVRFQQLKEAVITKLAAAETP